MNATPFRTRLRNRERLIGTFVKTTSPHVVEVLGRSGLDFLILDGEHAPFDRRDIDVAVLAGRTVNCPLLVRVPNLRADTMLDVLDLGATGVLAPHVRSVADARQVLAACRYRDGARSFSNSARAGDYGALTMPELVEQADTATAVLCQIEDREAVAAVADIAAIDGLDCLFIGRADLALSYGATNMSDAVVVAAVERVCAAGRAAGRPVGMFLPDLRDVAAYEALGVTLFLIGSDQAMLRAQGAALATQFRR
ncbi:MAG TPA: aldolase/citrate lyase family protein [Vicinamibacterales bacterium]|nr:aldolase/citrate lyase family protein [Vicinamibacterales bacterium]